MRLSANRAGTEHGEQIVAIETSEYVGMLRRCVRALGRRAGDDVDALATFTELAELVDATMAEAARSCHAAGYSWTEIGDALGVSRQAARQRFGQPDAEKLELS